MRKLALLFAIGSFSTVWLSSCIPNDPNTGDDSATVIGSALSSQDGATSFSEADISGQQDPGLKSAEGPSQSASATTVYTYKTITNTKDTASKSATDGTRTWTFSRSYTLSTKFKIATSGTSVVTTVDSLLSSHSYSGTFSGPKLSSSHSGNSTIILTNIGTYKSVNLDWTLNGTYSRTGTTTIKASGDVMTYSTQITFANVVFNHITKAIASGTATATISGSDKKKSFTYTGAITFNGDATSKLVIGGKTYTINLTTGETK